jgi:exodeoxyribonuclease V gamma subunit
MLNIIKYAADKRRILLDIGSQQLQNDMLNNLTAVTPIKNDHSISIHSCHSRIREVEVLKDQLLHALETDHTIEIQHIIL